LTQRLKRLHQIEPDDYVLWMDNRVTQNFLEVVLREIEAIQRDLGEGSAYKEGDPFYTAHVYAKAMGQQAGLAYIHAVEYEDLIEDE